MPDALPIHPRTGLRAVGIVGGRPVWPILGGSSPEPPASPAVPTPTASGPAGPPAPTLGPLTVDVLGAVADPMDTDAGRRALAAERQRAADERRRADAAEARLAEIDSANQTELERAQARATELEQKYTAAEAQRLRLQVATEHRISTDDLVLLTGTTQEELTAQATRIAALTTAGAAATAPPAFVPAPGQHAGNGSPPSPAATVAAGAELYRQRKTTTTP